MTCLDVCFIIYIGPLLLIFLNYLRTRWRFVVAFKKSRRARGRMWEMGRVYLREWRCRNSWSTCIRYIIKWRPGIYWARLCLLLFV